jgi:hypothetical protein
MSFRLVDICDVWKDPRNFLVKVKRSEKSNYFSRNTCCLTLKMEELQSFKISVSVYLSTDPDIPQDVSAA